MKKRMIAWTLMLFFLISLLPAPALGADSEVGNTDQATEIIAPVDASPLPAIPARAEEPAVLMEALSGECGVDGSSVRWTLDTVSGVLTISAADGSGTMATWDYGDNGTWNPPPWYDVNDQIRSVVIQNGVTNVGPCAFYDTPNLESADIAGSVELIGESAFKQCAALQSVSLHNGIREIGQSAFQECGGLSEVTIPGSVEVIGVSAFQGCNSLNTLNLAKGLGRIEADAFRECSSLGSLDLPDTLTGIGEGAFYDCCELNSVSIPGSVVRIGDSAFENVYYMTELTLSEGLQEIGAGAFRNCSCLNGFSIPESVTRIDSGAFDGCSSLLLEVRDGSYAQVYALENNVRYKLEGTEGDTPVYTASGVCGAEGPEICWTLDSTGRLSFLLNSESPEMADWEDGMVPWRDYRGEIKRIILPSGIQNIGSWAFSYLDNVSGITVPNSVERIGAWAFHASSGLKSITLSSSLTEIGDYAFCDCSNIRLTLPDTVRMIGEGAFQNCTSLTQLQLPNALETIGSFAFQGSSGLRKMTIPGSVIMIGESVFDDIPDPILTVTKHSVGWGYALANGIRFALSDSSEISDYVATGSCGAEGSELYWMLDENGFLTFDYSGESVEMENWDDWYNRAPWAGYAHQILRVVIPAGLSNIGNYAFYACENLSSVTIAGTVSQIGRNAFSDCAALTEVTLSPGVTSIGYEVFSNCPILEEIELPEDIASIGERAFADCPALTSVYLPASLTEVFWNIIENSPNASLYVYTDSFAWQFALSYSIPFTLRDGEEPDVIYIATGECGAEGSELYWMLDEEGLLTFTFVGSSASMDNWDDWYNRAPWADYAHQILRVVIPAGLSNIGNYAFHACENLSSVTVAGTVSQIGRNAFSDCAALAEVVLFPGVTSIGYAAFYNCPLLEEIELPEGVLTVGEESFANCQALKSLLIPRSLSEFGANTLDNSPEAVLQVYKKSFAWQYVLRYDLPFALRDSGEPDVSYIVTGPCGLDDSDLYWMLEEGGRLTFDFAGDSAAMADWSDSWYNSAPWSEYRDQILEIVIPEGVSNIGNYAFYSCENLESVTIPSTVSRVGTRAFRGCTELKTVELPAGVTDIGDYAFYGCENLSSVMIPSTVTALGEGTFQNCAQLGVLEIPSSVSVVPDGCFDNCPEVIFRVSEGDAAWLYALKYNLPVVLPGSEDNTPLYLESGSCGTGSNDLYWFISTEGTLRFAFSGDSAGMDDWNWTRFGEWRTDEAGNEYYYREYDAPWADWLEQILQVEIPSGVTRIGDHAFYRCKNLSSVSIPDSVTSIGSEAFRYCPALETLEIPASVTSLGDSNVFSDCPKLILSVTEGSEAKRYATENDLRFRISDSEDPSSAYVASGTCGEELYWHLDAAGTLSFEFTGDSAGMDDWNWTRFGEWRTDEAGNEYYYSEYDTPWADWLEQILRVEIPSGVTRIGDHAFYRCNNLSSVSIPDSVASIGSEAFRYCTALKLLELPAGVSNFSDDYAFSDCPELLLSVTEGDSSHRYALKIGVPFILSGSGDTEPRYLYTGSCGADETELYWQLDGAGLLTFAVFDAPAVMAPRYSWENRTDAIYDVRRALVPEGVAWIGDEAFADCEELTSVSLPESLTGIGNYAFRNCDALEEIELPENLTEIGYQAFYDCDQLFSVTLPDKVTTVGGQVFYSCDELHTLTLPASLTEMAEDACDRRDSLLVFVPEDSCAEGFALRNNLRYTYSGSYSLRPLYTASGSVESEGDELFWVLNDEGLLTFLFSGTGASLPDYDNPWYDYREDIRTVVLPEGIQSIGSEAFYNFFNMESVSVPNTLRSIGSSAFNGCRQLTSILLPDTLTDIGAYTFYDCEALEEMTLPQDLSSLGDNAFSGCDSLKQIVIPGNLTEIPSCAFNSGDALEKVMIPGTVTAIGYDAFPWNATLYVTRDSFTLSYAMENGLTYEVVDDLPRAISFLETAVSVPVGETVTLTAQLLPENVVNATLTWSSTNPEAATVARGLVTGVSEGTAIITVYTVNRLAATCTVTVTPPVQAEQVTLDLGELSLEEGKSQLLTARVLPENTYDKTLTWTSSDENVVLVHDGVITGLRAGTATITVTTANGITARCRVTVTLPVAAAGVTLDQETLVLRVNETAALTARVLPENASNQSVTWSSADRSIATVNREGVVTMVSEGSTVITATTRDGEFTASCTVHTPIRATGVRLDKNAVFLRVGETEALCFTTIPEDADISDVVWTSTNRAVADVSSDGTITALTTGTTSIVVVVDRVSAVCVVTVTDEMINATGVTLNAGEIQDMEIGSSRTLVATVLPENASNRSLRWASSDPQVAVVSNGGVVSAVGAGTAVITVTTDDGGFTRTCRVTVREKNTIDHLEAVLPAGNVTVQGSPLNAAGLVVTAFYSDGSSAEVAGYSISGYDPASTLPGRHEITVTVPDPEDETVSYSAYFTAVVVEREAVGITVAQKPIKRSYSLGEDLDTAGLSVEKLFSDGSSEPLDPAEYLLEGFDSRSEGTVTVTVRYEGFTDTFTVTIYAASASDGTPPMISTEGYYGGKRVLLSAAVGSVIYYTTDGSEPDSSSLRYDPASPIELSETTTVKAISYLNGIPSLAASARITLPQALAPIPSHFSGSAPESGPYASMQVPAGTLITLRSETPGAAIYYTVDGSTPDTSGLLYGSSIMINTSVTIKAITVKQGYRTSEICEISYDVPQSSEQSEETIISLGSVTAKAGDTFSLPVYILSDSPVNEFRFTLSYDSSRFSFRSVTPGEGVNAAELLVGADEASGEVTFLYSGNALETSEMFSLNLLALASDEDGVYPVDISENHVIKVRTESTGTVMVSVSSGRITLSGSANSSLLNGSVSFLSGTDGEELDSAAHVSDNSEVTANVELEGAAEELGVIVNVYLVVYNRRGAMTSMDTWEVEVSNMGTAFMQSITIPRNVDVGSIKLIILSDDNVPLMMSGLL